MLLRRVEGVWRELRLQSLALQMALVSDDEKALGGHDDPERLTAVGAPFEEVRSERAVSPSASK